MRVVFHEDVNSAFLSWEAAYQLHHLGAKVDLREIPSAVGGDQEKRHGIILAKCNTWFTSTGITMPLSFKFEDDAGQIQAVRDLNVLYSENKNYSGIPSKEYGCEAIIGGFIKEFKLIFYLESCLWVMLI